MIQILKFPPDCTMLHSGKWVFFRSRCVCDVNRMDPGESSRMVKFIKIILISKHTSYVTMCWFMTRSHQLLPAEEHKETLTTPEFNWITRLRKRLTRFHPAVNLPS